MHTAFEQKSNKAVTLTQILKIRISIPEKNVENMTLKLLARARCYGSFAF